MLGSRMPEPRSGLIRSIADRYGEGPAMSGKRMSVVDRGQR